MRKWMTLLVCAVLGAFVVQGGADERVEAQELGMLPDEVSADVWEAFTGSLSEDADYGRVASFRRAEMEPLIEQWEQSHGVVFVASWSKFRDAGIEIESEPTDDDVRWTIERKTYTMRYGTFQLYVLRQLGGGRFSETWIIPEERLKAIDFEFLTGIRQGSPFEAEVDSFETSGEGAAGAMAQLCAQVGADYSIPAGEDAESRITSRFRGRSVSECLHSVADSVGWDVSIRDGMDGRSYSVSLRDVEEWLEIRDEVTGATTESWRGALSRILELKLVEVDTEDLFVHVGISSN